MKFLKLHSYRLTGKFFVDMFGSETRVELDFVRMVLSRRASFFISRHCNHPFLTLPIASSHLHTLDNNTNKRKKPEITNPLNFRLNFKQSNHSFNTIASQTKNPIYPIQINLVRSNQSKMSTASLSFPVTKNLTKKLTDAFTPSHLEVINESHMHNV